MSLETCQHKHRQTVTVIGSCLPCSELLHDTIESSLSHQKPHEPVYGNLSLNFPSDVRLVVLSLGGGTDSINCTIKHVSLQQEPNYSAASYTWATEAGGKNKSDRIKSNGTNL
jgi:hypothetical protein